MTIRTKDDLLNNVFQEGQNPNSITASDIRDLVASAQMTGGYAYYENTGTLTLLTSESTSTLTNNAAGAGTYKNWKASGVTDVWNSTTNRFDFTQLDVGDLVEIRLDVEQRTSDGYVRTVKTNLVLAQGTSSERTIGLGIGVSSMPATTHAFSFNNTIFISSADIRANPAALTVTPMDAGINFKVVGILARVVKV